ncbi:MAG: VOC family protein [Pseudomonadota bacterium]
MAKVLSLGGVFFKSKDPEALGKWYQEHLGMQIDPSFGGCVFMPDQMPNKGYNIWTPFKHDTKYLDPSSSPFMINLIVDDIDGAIAQVKAAGADIHDEVQRTEFGAFGWFSDPDGNKIELWQPDAIAEPDGG